VGTLGIKLFYGGAGRGYGGGGRICLKEKYKNKQLTG